MLIETFDIRVGLTEKLELPGLRPCTEIYKVGGLPLRSEVYILDSPEVKSVACHPHIVGDELIESMGMVAYDAVKALMELTSIGELEGDEIVFEHVLRAAPGYCLHEALRGLGIDFREVWIRPRYKLPSYRDHDEENVKEIEVVYQDFSMIPEGRDLVVVKPDTEASGRTAEVALQRLHEEAEKKSSKLRELIVYGFISEYGMRVIEEKALKVGFEKVYFIALGDITALCYNMYDMPLYGPDESYYSEYREVRKLGGITDYQVFEKYVLEFIPGADQPGDWSARQKILFTGVGYEPGGIVKHLENSISLVSRLWDISRGQEWFMEFHEEAMKKELEQLRNKLNQMKE
ncbi:MAG: hypothetical protein LZ173_06005 [Thaumarchaeota archaeon]|jgi:hypothetical protein|nr:hypothetical protein [Candidatus Geocrenenecus arthurdayi]